MSNGHPSVWWSQVFAVLERLYGVGENQSKIHDSLSWVLLWLHLTVTCSHPHCYPDQWPVSCCMDFSALHRRCVAPESVQTLIFSNCKTQQSGACRIQRSPNRLQQYSFDWHFFRANFYLLQTVSQKKNTRAGKLSDRIRAQTMTSSWVLLWLRLIPQKQISCGMDSRTPQWCCVVQESIPWFTCNKSKANQFQSYTGLAGWMITSSSWCRGFGGPLVRVNIPKSLRLWLWLWLTD